MEAVKEAVNELSGFLKDKSDNQGQLLTLQQLVDVINTVDGVTWTVSGGTWWNGRG